MAQIWERNPEIVWRMLQGEAVLLNPGNGEYFGLNEVGSAIWDHLDGNRTVTEIVALLSAEYDAPQEVLEADVAELLSDLDKKGLLREKG